MGEHGGMSSRGLLGALAGVLAAAAALGVGELVAVLLRPAASPVLAVGNRVITLTPESAKRSAIDSFGTNDKTVLIWSIFLGIALFGAVVGTFATSRPARRRRAVRPRRAVRRLLRDHAEHRTHLGRRPQRRRHRGGRGACCGG